MSEEVNNNFIFVHDDNDNSPIVINENYIISIYYIHENETVVRMNTNMYNDNDNAIDSFGINETPEKLYNQLSKSKYIKVHDIRDNTIIVLSIKDIITVYKETNSNGKNISNIELSDGTDFRVYESVEAVMKLCKGNT